MKKLLFLLLLCAPAFAQGPSPHSATTTWTQSVTPGITSNSVFRGTVMGGPYVRIWTSLSAATTYTDSTVSAGATYFYVVTASVDVNESKFSNEWRAVIPQDTASPQTLTGTVK